MTNKSRATNRPKRTPIANRNILTASERPGYTRRWVNDTDSRIAEFKAAGYEVVYEEDADTSDARAQDATRGGSAVSKHVGSGTTAYLMEIPNEYYAEDQKAKQDAIDEKEKSFDPSGQIKENIYGYMNKS